MSDPLASNTRWKDNLDATGLAIGCGFNTFFTTLSLIDLSADLHATALEPTSPEAAARLAFLSQYYTWRGAMPVVGTMLMCLLPLLPFVLFIMVHEGVQSVLGWRKARFWRHLTDVLTPCMVFLILIPTVVTMVLPVQEAVLTTCSWQALGDGTSAVSLQKCFASASATVWPHLMIVGANCIMFVLAVAKYAGNANEACQICTPGCATTKCQPCFVLTVCCVQRALINIQSLINPHAYHN